MTNKLRIAVIAVCALAVTLPVLAMPFCRSGGETDENRYLADYPRLVDEEGSLNGDFAEAFESWLDDHFAFRRHAVRLNALANYRLLNTCVSGDVIAGRDGWLYYADTVADYTGEGRLSDEELAGMQLSLRSLSEELAAHGAGLYVAVVPNKATVYPAFMPARYHAHDGEDNIDRLRRACEGLPLTWIDLKSPLQAAAAGNTLVYRKTDTHWNDLGAALSAGVILGAMGREAAACAINGEVQLPGGDLARLAGMPDDLWEAVPGVEPAVSLPAGDYEQHRLNCEGSGSGRLLVYRDSFGTAIGPWLAQAFGETELIWRSPPDGSIPCDVALLLICERNLRLYLLPDPESDAGELPGASEDEAPEDESFAEEIPEGASFEDISPDDDIFSDDPEDASFEDIAPDDDIFSDDPEDASFEDIVPDDDVFSDDPEDASFEDIGPDDDVFSDDPEDDILTGAVFPTPHRKGGAV